MAVKVSFDDLRNPHFAENIEAYNELKRLGWFTEEELQELWDKQMALDMLGAGESNG